MEVDRKSSKNNSVKLSLVTSKLLILANLYEKKQNGDECYTKMELNRTRRSVSIGWSSLLLN